MARRRAGQAVFTRTGKIRGREHEGLVAVIQKSEVQSRVGRIQADGTADSSTEELVATKDLIDVRPAHVVATAQRGILTIPVDFRNALQIEEETPLLVVQEAGWLAIHPLKGKPPGSSAPTLEDLLKQITPENLHAEIDTGPSVGREVF